MSVYTAFYESVYGGFPAGVLDATVELSMDGWTDISSYVLQREGTEPAITVSRGRPDETSSATPSSAAMQWNNRNGQFSPRNPTGPYYGLLGRNTPLRISVPDSGTYLRFADFADTSITCADSTALHITGSIDIRIDCDLDDWQPCQLASKFGLLTADQAWAVTLNGDGSVTLTWNNGAALEQVSCSGLAVMPLGRSMLRVTLNATTGTVQFWTAATMAGTQTLLATVAGSGSTAIQAASGQAVAIGVSQGYQSIVDDIDALLGKVYEFQLWNSSGTLVADPQFFAQTPGASSFADAQGNTWSLSGSTAELSSRSYRIHAECSSLPQAWDVTGTDVWTPVGASGVLRRLQQGNSPVASVMKRGISGLGGAFYAGGWGTVAYWPAEDPSGSSQIASGLAGGTPMSLAGTPGFQGQAGSLSADSVFACSASLPTVGTSSWTGRIPAYSASDTDAAVMILLEIPSGGLSANATLMTIPNTGGGWINLNYATGSGGELNLGGDVSTTGPTGINGVAMWVQIFANGVLNILPLSGAETTWAGSGSAAGRFTSVIVNPEGSDLGDAELGQIWVAAEPSDIGTAIDLLLAFTGETAANRFVRLCSENNITSRIYGYPDVSALMGPQSIDTLANLFQYCEDADRGQIYEPAETLGLGYRTNASLCSQSPSVSFSYAQAQLGGDGSQGLVPTDDDQHTINDVTVSRNNGSSYQAQVTTGSMSINEPRDGGVGDYSTSLTVYCAYDAQLPDIAWWMAWIGSTDEERYPVIPLNLARTELGDLFYAIQDVRIGGFIEITGLPAWLPPGPAEQLVYGAVEKLGGFFWQVTWNAVPESPYEVAVAGVARAASGGSELATSYDSTATSLSVETTAGNIWTTDSSGGTGQQMMIPLYSYPPSAFWTDATAAYPQTGIIIANISSGPGSSYESNFAAVYAAAEAAGILVVGYVYTSYGARSSAAVEADVATWESLYGITSILFDEVSTSATEETYYQGLCTYVHGAHSGSKVVLNCGAIPAEGYFSVGADVICVVEDTYANFAADAAAAPGWLFDYPATSIAATCNTCSTEGDMVTAVGLSQSAFNAGFVWVTADGIYAAEPSYFADEVAELAGESGSGSFPFSIIVAGEEMTVTDITGSSSPQTFTVIRSVNGVVKSQASGAAVVLADTPVAALAGLAA